jgi:hypothetical protein
MTFAARFDSHTVDHVLALAHSVAEAARIRMQIDCLKKGHD